MRHELVRRLSGRKGVYRKISGVLEDPVHTRLIPAIWLEFRKEGESAACRGAPLRRVYACCRSATPLVSRWLKQRLTLRRKVTGDYSMPSGAPKEAHHPLPRESVAS